MLMKTGNEVTQYTPSGPHTCHLIHPPLSHHSAVNTLKTLLTSQTVENHKVLPDSTRRQFSDYPVRPSCTVLCTYVLVDQKLAADT